MDGALLAINYAFAVWPFRKLYADVHRCYTNNFRFGPAS